MDDGFDDNIRGSEDEQTTPYRVSVRPSMEFSYDAARMKLASLRIGTQSGPTLVAQDGLDIMDISGEQQRQQNLVRLAAWVNLSSKASVGCIGAVLGYLQRQRAVDYIPRDSRASGGMVVATVEMFSLKDTMFINSDTICSLQIFENEGHPNFQVQGKRRGKEGLSLFGIMNSTKTPNGFAMLKQWFLRPTLSLPVLHQRHGAIAHFSRPQNSHVVVALCKSFSRIKNIPKVLGTLRRGKAKAAEWTSLLQVCFNRRLWADLLL